MHLYILSYFVCAVSLTHSFRLFKPHLARNKCIINRHLHWMPFKLELFSCETTCILATVISTVSVHVAVISLPEPLTIKGSARNWQDVRLEVWECKKSADSITGRWIGASLNESHALQSQSSVWAYLHLSTSCVFTNQTVMLYIKPVNNWPHTF